MGRSLRAVLALVVIGAACGGSSRAAELSRMGLHVAPESSAGWYRIRADEGYSLSMPGIPLAEREELFWGGVPVPQCFFDLSTEGDSRGYLVRVFDARELSTDSREQLRQQALDLFLPSGTEVIERRPWSEAGATGEQLVVDGYSAQGHVGFIRSFVRDGFVWQMLLVTAPGAGAPTDAEPFFRSARTP